GHTSLNAYRANLRKLMQYLRGERVALARTIEREMKRAAKAKEYEQAAALRNQLFAMQELGQKTLFGDRENLDASRDQALVELADLLSLPKPPCRIEGFDISHMGGTDNVASMVVFTNGVPDKAAYRKFKMRLSGNDDFAHMEEVAHRRFREENRKKWGLPDFVLIDGGKGQLSAALAAQAAAGVHIPTIGLAKKEEEIIISKDGSLPGQSPGTIAVNAKKAGAYVTETEEFITVLLPQSHLVKLLQRIRDESHRFAVSYHSTLKRRRQTASVLDDIPGIGPHTRKKLLRQFRSLRGIIDADTGQLATVVGAKKAELLTKYLKTSRV
ncbi:MAG: helix-hairpin-helix domain-containing protein, partial [Candidatus Saccharimonadales bacterium]